MKKPRVLLYDIETAPNKGWIWGKYEQNVIDFETEWYMLSFAYKWLGERKVHFVGLPDFKTEYKKDPENDLKLVEALHALQSEADVVIAHNGDKFDQRRSNSRFLVNKLGPVTPFKSIDTLKIARRYFGFNSNKLDDLGRTMGLGRKVAHTGKHLWFDCMAGKPAAWKLMKKYNLQDVKLLEEVYLEMLPWIDNHPKLNVLAEAPDACPKCLAVNSMTKNGTKLRGSTRVQQFRCQSCGGYAYGRLSLPELRPNYV